MKRTGPRTARTLDNSSFFHGGELLPGCFELAWIQTAGFGKNRRSGSNNVMAGGVEVLKVLKVVTVTSGNSFNNDINSLGTFRCAALTGSEAGTGPAYRDSKEEEQTNRRAGG